MCACRLAVLRTTDYVWQEAQAQREFIAVAYKSNYEEQMAYAGVCDVFAECKTVVEIRTDMRARTTHISYVAIFLTSVPARSSVFPNSSITRTHVRRKIDYLPCDSKVYVCATYYIYM